MPSCEARVSLTAEIYSSLNPVNVFPLASTILRPFPSADDVIAISIPPLMGIVILLLLVARAPLIFVLSDS
jgi:hypothetical protein